MPSSRRSKPHREDPVFFLDRALGRSYVADMLRKEGHTVLPMAEVYPNGADERIADDDWIMRADQENWVALTKDYALILDHSQNLERTRLRVFALNNANLTGPEMAERIRYHLQRILQRSQKPGPYVYAIGKERLERRWPRENDS